MSEVYLNSISLTATTNAQPSVVPKIKLVRAKSYDKSDAGFPIYKVEITFMGNNPLKNLTAAQLVVLPGETGSPIQKKVNGRKIIFTNVSFNFLEVKAYLKLKIDGQQLDTRKFTLFADIAVA